MSVTQDSVNRQPDDVRKHYEVRSEVIGLVKDMVANEKRLAEKYTRVIEEKIAAEAPYDVTFRNQYKKVCQGYQTHHISSFDLALQGAYHASVTAARLSHAAKSDEIALYRLMHADAISLKEGSPSDQSVSESAFQMGIGAFEPSLGCRISFLLLFVIPRCSNIFPETFHCVLERN